MLLEFEEWNSSVWEASSMAKMFIIVDTKDIISGPLILLMLSKVSIHLFDRGG